MKISIEYIGESKNPNEILIQTTKDSVGKLVETLTKLLPGNIGIFVAMKLKGLNMLKQTTFELQDYTITIKVIDSLKSKEER